MVFQLLQGQNIIKLIEIMLKIKKRLKRRWRKGKN